MNNVGQELIKNSFFFFTENEKSIWKMLLDNISLEIKYERNL